MVLYKLYSRFKELPLVSYEEIYAFYEKRKREYIERESADIFEKEEEDENVSYKHFPIW